VYLVFWGSQWDSDSNGVEQYMQSFMSGLGQSNDNWSTINSQYTDSSGQGPSFGGSVFAGSWVDNGSPAPQSAAQSDLAAEAVAGAQHFGVSGDDIQIVVLSPSGTNPDGFPNTGFCAWHDFTASSVGNIPYTNMPYVLDAGSGCGASSVQNQLDGFSIVEGHEYAETLTDPEPASGWVDSQGAEIGDKCAWQNLFAINLSTGSFAMQPLWSNNDNGCTQQAP
jgi:serine protease